MPENTKSQYATDQAGDLVAGIRNNILTATTEMALAHKRLDDLVRHVTGNRSSIDFEEVAARVKERR